MEFNREEFLEQYQDDPTACFWSAVIDAIKFAQEHEEHFAHWLKVSAEAEGYPEPNLTFLTENLTVYAESAEASFRDYLANRLTDKLANQTIVFMFPEIPVDTERTGE